MFTMLFNSENKTKLPSLIFGGIALAIVFIVGYVVIVAVQKSSVEPVSNVSPIGPSPKELVDTYKASIANLRQAVTTHSGSAEELLSVVENSLLTFRVPKEMLDLHIAAVLQIRQIHAQVLPEKEALRERLQTIIASLQTAASAL